MSEIKLTKIKNCAHCGKSSETIFAKTAFCESCGYYLPIEKWNKRASHWRKIESDADLPGEKGFYFVCFEDEGKRNHAPMWFSPKQKTFLLIYPGVGFEQAVFDKIIAWMPLPEPFEGE